MIHIKRTKIFKSHERIWKFSNYHAEKKNRKKRSQWILLKNWRSRLSIYQENIYMNNGNESNYSSNAWIFMQNSISTFPLKSNLSSSICGMLSDIRSYKIALFLSDFLLHITTEWGVRFLLSPLFILSQW